MSFLINTAAISNRPLVLGVKAGECNGGGVN